MKTQHITKIKKVVESERLVSKRAEILSNMGYTVLEVPMGPGGVLQQKKMRDGSVRVQIGYGHGKHNYAKAVIL